MYQEVPLVEVENRQQRKEERARERGGGVGGALNWLDLYFILKRWSFKKFSLCFSEKDVGLNKNDEGILSRSLRS